MARKRLRLIRSQSKGKRRQKTDPGGKKSDSMTSAPPMPQPASLTKQDIVSKLIPLRVPSAKDARKNAEKAIDNVFSAVRHALSEGDLNIADFGEITASRDAKGGNIRICFTPDDRLKQAVEARLNATSSRRSARH